MTMPGGRFSGVLLHPTSLPGPYGLGEFGPEALRFMTRMRAAGQKVWQFLPLGPTGYGESPYQGLSVFAGNPLLVGMDWLRRDGLLEDAEVRVLFDSPLDHVDFARVAPLRLDLLARAARRFERLAGPGVRTRWQRFVRQQGRWLEDFALYAALKEARGGAAWFQWPSGLARRDPARLAAARREHAAAIRRVTIEQFLHEEHWQRLRKAAHQHGLALFGDMPLFVSLDSADVWSRPDLFQLDEQGRPTRVAGVPPDYFSARGQRWGNPLYRWQTHRAEGYAWWRERFRGLLRRMDMIRSDHFRGFCAHWSLPADASHAIEGYWQRGPGLAFFRQLAEDLGPLPVVAENLGVITPAVEKLRKKCGFPGMNILQFSLAPERTAQGWRIPRTTIPEDCLIYTGTHDNDTLRGWFEHSENRRSGNPLPRRKRWQKAVLQALDTDADDVHWGAIRWAFHSSARGAIVPMQDLLGLDSSARMNQPGHASGHWRWRYRREQLRKDILDALRALTLASGRG